MKRRKSKAIIVVFPILVLVFFCERCFALGDAIGDPTVPPTSVRSGLIRTPSPVDLNGNLTITGNVRGGMQFRGLVPYRAGTEFGAPLGSEDIGSFLRRSAPISLSRLQFLPQPYYLPSSTVSSITTAGIGGGVTYPRIRINQGTGDFVITEMPNAGKITDIPVISPLYDYRRTMPLSYEPTDLERIISYALIRESDKKKLIYALQRASEGTHKILPAEDQQTQKTTPSTLLKAEPVEPIKQSFEAVEPLLPGQAPPTKTEETAAKKSVYEQMLEQVAETKQKQEAPQSAGQKPEEQQVEKSEEKTPSGLGSEFSEIDKGTAEALVGVHKSFATQSKDKFNYYMRAAEEFLKRGKYYRAVDAYTLANIYKPDDPLAYAGRAHALFASGEYMSSAYFLARAISIFPEYVKFKIDLNAMIPDKDQLESRITDVKQWIEKTQSAELSFLLAYIYYQLDRPELAVKAINFAAEKIPDSASIKALKQAIEKK
jgi:tetratricopeptide (TPR) repeat protein